MADQEYEKLRATYQPDHIKWLFVSESPPPAQADKVSTRHFYRTGIVEGDRLFANTMKALYPEARNLSEQGLAAAKAAWLSRFQSDGCYQIETLDESLPHGTTPAQRKQKIKDNLEPLIQKIRGLSAGDTKIILIKSNPFTIATEPLRAAGFNVINEALIDYPGYWREEPYRTKLAELMAKHGWKSS